MGIPSQCDFTSENSDYAVPFFALEGEGGSEVK